MVIASVSSKKAQYNVIGRGSSYKAYCILEVYKDITRRL